MNIIFDIIVWAITGIIILCLLAIFDDITLSIGISILTAIITVCIAIFLRLYTTNDEKIIKENVKQFTILLFEVLDRIDNNKNTIYSILEKQNLAYKYTEGLNLSDIDNFQIKSCLENIEKLINVLEKEGPLGLRYITFIQYKTIMQYAFSSFEFIRPIYIAKEFNHYQVDSKTLHHHAFYAEKLVSLFSDDKISLIKKFREKWNIELSKTPYNIKLEAGDVYQKHHEFENYINYLISKNN